MKIVRKINFNEKKKSEGKENAKNSKPCKPWRCTHTHTSTFREIRRVALFGVENRLFVALYEEKNKVLEIACFLRGIFQKRILKKYYTYVKSVSNLAEVGGVE